MNVGVLTPSVLDTRLGYLDTDVDRKIRYLGLIGVGEVEEHYLIEEGREVTLRKKLLVFSKGYPFRSSKKS